MIPLYALGIVAAALVGAVCVYILVAWRKAPRASRAMKWIAAASLSAGIMIGIFGGQMLRPIVEERSGIPFGIWRSNPCSPAAVRAADLGKAIVLENQQHVGDPLWIDIMWLRESCSMESETKHLENQISSLSSNPTRPSPPTAQASSECVAYFLARHAIGSDLTAGDTRKCIPYEEVAEMCFLGNPAKDSAFCKQAFEFQRQRVKP